MGVPLFLLKLVLTAGVCGLIWWSLSEPDQGILAEVTAFGPVVGALVALAFLAAVIAYCRDLVRLMHALRPASRRASPTSFWLMLVIPWNFVEDFFIIASLAASLRSEAADRPDLIGRWGRFGLVSGLAWCGLQIVSLVPHPVGSAAGLLALPFWLWHWRFARRARADLAPG